MGILTTIKAEDVTNQNLFARYVQQELGTPVPFSPKERAQLSREVKHFFEEHPDATWATMIKVVAYCKNHKRRPALASSVFKEVRYAWSKGYLPELDPQERVEQDPRIAAALIIETDDQWRRKLATTTGDISTKVYLAWKEHRLAEI